MQEMPTIELEARMKDLDTSDLGDFYKNNSTQMADENRGFYYYMSTTIKDKGLFFKDVYSFADLSERRGEQILRMEKHTNDRDLILRLCIAGHFTIEEINRALKLYGMSPLYAKDKRDANIILAIHKRGFDLYEINDSLIRHGFEPLIKEPIINN